MDATIPFHVEVDRSRLPGKFIVVVAETGCRTLYWPFFKLSDADRKAKAELERLQEEYLN
jgi:hypothetical protein